ncbi:TetR/AcrR family transcriptional regulator [Streptomyces omiyaensis]|uniref:TetR/AcrR family transcriptional regulator n=1 Tax=Streptomyces omiyaensis TaxID=68247 RepID=A0ABW7C0A2_9ACTN|nr:TetR/AcrR family transcriptional regulator [Streptomyces omiyaensis]GGY24427.1 TetR family transcriptional regulator [Streptomyces omiyaensis]
MAAGKDDLDAYGIPVVPAPAGAASRKRRAIVDAALTEFLAEGYSAASMDAVTARSGVSKATVYKHFGSKERLFLAVIGDVLRKTCADLEPAGQAIAAAPDLRSALVRLTTDRARILLRPDVMALRRLVIGEIDRFPQLGRLWCRVGHDVDDGPLVEALTALDARGDLAVPDPKLAARQLVAATVGVPQLVRTFSPEAEIDEAELERVIGSGVDLFLARYATGA